MPEQPPGAPQDEGWRDIGLTDIARGVGALINFVSDVAASFGSAMNQSRTPAARPFNARPYYSPPSFAPEPPRPPLFREPLLDLFDEGEEIVIVVEWPDGDLEQLAVSVDDDVLCLAFGAGGPIVDMLLPAAVAPASLRQRASNGIAEIRLRRA